MNKMGVTQPNRTGSRPTHQPMVNGHRTAPNGFAEDINPRARPSPHHIKAPSAEPTVPEVTIFFDGESAETTYMDLPTQRAPLADIYGPNQNQRLSNGASAAGLRKPMMPVSQINGHRSHQPVNSQDELDSYPRNEHVYPGATSRQQFPQQVPTCQYQVSRPVYPQRPTNPSQDYYKSNAQANGPASHGAIPHPRQAPTPFNRPAPVPYNHTCIPSSVQRNPRPAEQRHVYPAPQPHMGGSYPEPRGVDPHGYHTSDPRLTQGYNPYPSPHDAMQARPQYYQPAQGPSRVDPAVNSKMTLAETMQNLNIRLKPSSPGSGSGSGSAPDSLNNSSEGSVMTVPPDVYELLRMQDAQLKELREQLAKLLAKQESELQPRLQSKHVVTLATQTSMCETPKRVVGEQCSVGINTSLIQDHTTRQSAQSHMASVQTSPPPQHQRHSVASQDVERFHFPTTEPHRHGQQRKLSPAQRKQGHRSKVSPGYHSNTSPSDGQRPPSSQMTSPGEADQNDSYTLGEIHLTQIQGGTEESMLSEMMVDMPAYTSHTPQKSSSGDMADSEDSSGSPGLGESVSMYERGESVYDQETHPQEDTGYGESTQEAELVVNYKQLLGNVQKFLAKNSNGDHSADVGPNTTTDTMHNQSLSDNGMDLSGANLNRSVHSANGVNGSVHSTGGGSFHSHHSAEAAPWEKQPVPRTPTRPQALNKSIDFTQRELEKMGIFPFDTPSGSDRSRLDQSMFLETEFLPRVEYESLMLTDDSDLSACADQLAMKYLSDEQLSELARLKPSTQKRGLGRVTNPNTTLTNPMNHMSFATRKYMERYGLLDNASPDVSVPENGPELVNVTAFLENLHQSSCVNDSRGSHQGAYNQTLSQSCNGALPNHTSQTQSYCSASSISDHQGVPQHYYSDGDSHVGAQRPAENAAIHKMSTPKAPHPVHGASDHSVTPPRSQDKPFRMFQKTTANNYNNNQPPTHNNQLSSDIPQEKKPTSNVLDIARLKELPKLL